MRAGNDLKPVRAMKRARFAAVLFGMLFLGVAATGHTAGFTFETIPPGGNLAGSPGETVGWGYKIENTDPNYWLSVGNISSDPFTVGVPDATVFDYPKLAPGGSRTVNYNGMNGLLQVSIDTNAMVGSVDSGSFFLDADWYDGEPGGGGSFIGSADQQSAPYSLTVTAPVPEPGTMLLLGSGLAGLAGCGRRRRKE